jgi:hydrogenase nickel incorporation protein HypA/HybF
VHEYSIVRALIERIESEAAGRRATAVTSVQVRIGELSGVDVELLATAYRNSTGQTICSGSRLQVAAVPARWGCTACGAPVPPGGPRRCPLCGGAAALQQGDEILLERIEMVVERDGEEPGDVRDARL